MECVMSACDNVLIANVSTLYGVITACHTELLY